VEIWTEADVICQELCEKEFGPERKGKSVDDGSMNSLVWEAFAEFTYSVFQIFVL